MMNNHNNEIMYRTLEKIAKENNYTDFTVSIKEVSGTGSNMTSALYFVTLRAPGKPELKFFTKVAAMREQMRTNLPFCPFTIELYFYTKVQKQLKRLEVKHSVPDEHRVLMPKLYGSSDEYLREVLVLDDLRALGFKNFDRQNLADLEYVTTAIELIAKFHALSMAYFDDDPGSYAEASEALTMSVPKFQALMIILRPKTLANVLAVADERHRLKLEKYFVDDQTNGFQHFADIYRSKKRNILIHGDFKPSNLMHRRRNGKLVIIPLDYQLFREGDPVMDIMYFLFTATDEEFRRKHYHAMFDEYYVHLCAALHRLHLDPAQAYSEKTYREDLEETKMYGLVIGAVLLPLVLAEEGEIETLGAEDAYIGDLAVDPGAIFKERFNGILNNYAEWGLL